MKISMMSYTMARQDNFDVKKMFQLTRDLNLAGVDMVTLYDHDPRDLRKMADDFGVPIICHTFFDNDLASPDPKLRSQAADKCKQSLDAAVALGAPIVMIPTPPCNGDQERGQCRKLWILGVKELMPYARQLGVTVTLENFPGQLSPFVIASDLLEAIGEIPDLKITFDNGNASSGESPVDSYNACAKYVVHAHFKDWIIRDTPAEGFRPMLDGRYYQPALIGQGRVDHRGTLQAMKNAHYTGCINIEYESSDVPAAEAIRMARDFLLQTMAQLN